ncbi:uncharacterized protein ABDE67_022047 [Symphorus nematophorus]
MGLLWLILPVFVVCAEAENLTVVEVKLGQNVALNCTLEATTVYWYMEVHSQVRVCIARLYSSDKRFYVSTPVNKYVAINETNLLITNITAEDCRLYFCARKQIFSVSPEEAFRVVSDVPVTPSTHDRKADQQQQQHIWRMWPSELVILFALNVLLIVVTGLVFVSLCFKNYRVSGPSSSTREIPETQKTSQEIQPPADLPPECSCIYYEVKLPGSTPPRHRRLERLDDC